MDYSVLVSNFNGRTIKLPIVLSPANEKIRDIPKDHQLVLDTGADITAITEDFLMLNGYNVYQKSGKKKRTASGVIELLTCSINGITIANQFNVGKMKVDVLRGWEAHTVVGVLGMDVLSQMTFILSHEYQRFLLTGQHIPELQKIFKFPL